ncbi:hypothetical protein MJD09_14460, partial [bacterium]|nr:hypothetical protein [bacterium]
MRVLSRGGVNQSLPILTIALLGSSSLLAKDDEGFIYGRVTSTNNNVYQGAIRWGKEETFWTDMFNATKVHNSIDQYLSHNEMESLQDFLGSGRRSRRRSRNWPGIDTHEFKCRFGDIQRMDMSRGKRVLLTFKNGEEMEVSGSGDIGATIKIMDEELGKVDLKWRRIESVEFLPTPRNLDQKFGDPLYGVVSTRRGRFEGFIQWDHEECVSRDVLDGTHEDGKMSIEFGKIKSIVKQRRGSLVTLKSGREFYLKGSNDVNSENRGIVIRDPRIGKILVGWRDFEEVIFDNEIRDSGPSYKDFEDARDLEGEVFTQDGESISGRIIYDIDEARDFEILDGQNGHTKFRIAFRDIESIVPRGRHHSIVRLKSGVELDLEDSRDVNRNNDGVIILSGGNRVTLVRWEEIEEI